jgi:hypothetical protein
VDGAGCGGRAHASSVLDSRLGCRGDKLSGVGQVSAGSEQK